MRADQQLAIAWVGERWIRVSFPRAEPDDATRDLVRSAWSTLLAAPPRGVLGVTPAHASLLVECRPLTEHESPEAIIDGVRRLIVHAGSHAPPTPRAVDIPVCYDPALAPDLLDVVKTVGVGPDAIPSMHAQADHRVRFIGFAPGFAYIDGLPVSLHLPRLPRPRERVPAGSVAIAGTQTGIYPFELPGGWRIIGRTPLNLFDPQRDPPAMLRPGDTVRFVPISREQFECVRRSPGASPRG